MSFSQEETTRHRTAMNVAIDLCRKFGRFNLSFISATKLRKIEIENSQQEI